VAVAARPFQHFPGVAGQWLGGNNGTHRYLIYGSRFAGFKAKSNGGSKKCQDQQAPDDGLHNNSYLFFAIKLGWSAAFAQRAAGMKRNERENRSQTIVASVWLRA
jgi:hypothetical protein